MNMKKIIISIIESIVIIALSFVVFTQYVIPVEISGSSMENYLHDYSFALISGLYDEKCIERFDIVVLSDDTLNANIIKRIIGLPNDLIEMKNDVLYINGILVDQSFLDQSFIEYSKSVYETEFFTNDFSIQLYDNEYFVLGDNRLKSTDSRELGVYHIEDIIGVNGVVIYPFAQIQWLNGED